MVIKNLFKTAARPVFYIAFLASLIFVSSVGVDTGQAQTIMDE